MKRDTAADVTILEGGKCMQGWLPAAPEEGRGWVATRTPVDSGHRILGRVRNWTRQGLRKGGTCELEVKSTDVFKMWAICPVPACPPKGTCSLPAGDHVFIVWTKQKRQRGQSLAETIQWLETNHCKFSTLRSDQFPGKQQGIFN